MSHELRTPLNAIIGYSEILAEEAEDAGREADLADLQKIRTAGKMDLHLETFDVSAMLQDVVSTLFPLVEKNRNRLELVYGEALSSKLTVKK
ncbi:MAG: sensor histidine kinase [Methylococcales bacterium]